MTEISLNIICNVPESGSHMRCCTLRSSGQLLLRLVRLATLLMFLDKILDMFLLVMQGNCNFDSSSNS